MSTPTVFESRHDYSLGGDTRDCDDAVAGLNHVTTRFSPEVLSAMDYSPSIRVEGVANTVPVVFECQENPWHSSFPYGVGGLSILELGAHASRTPVPALFAVALPNVPRQECNPVSYRSLMRRFTYP